MARNISRYYKFSFTYIRHYKTKINENHHVHEQFCSMLEKING